MNRKNLEAMEALLAEYVNGSLDFAAVYELEEALNQSYELRDALERERLLKKRIAGGIDAMVDEAENNEEKRLTALLERNSEEQSDPAVSGEKRSSLSSMLKLLNPRKWHPALALSLALAIPAEAAVIATQSVAIASLEDENYRLASGPCGNDSGKSGILMEFNESASWSDVAGLLDQENLVIIDRGDFGTLTVRSKLEGGALTKQIETLGSSALVSNAAKVN